MRELEIEIKRLRVLMNQAFDDGDEIAGDSYIDEKLQTYGFVGSARLNKIFAV